MGALKVTMASSSSSSICIKQPQIDKWMRRLTPPPPATSTTTSVSNRTVVAVMTKSSVTNNTTNFINRKNGEGGGERISVWWRDGWRLISCADFGWGEQHPKRRNFGPKSSSFSSSSSSNKMGSDNKEEDRDENDPRSSSSSSSSSTTLQSPKLLTLPTILTLGRVAAIPLLVTTFYSNSWWATTITTSIFVVAAITDWLDGYLARKMRLGTPFGAFLDPVADKLMVAATLVLLCTRPLEVGAFGELPWLLPIPSIAIIGREITMSAVREWAASQNGKVLEAVAVNNLGKWKTASQMIALTILLATRDTSIVGSHILVPSGVALLYISAGLAVWSLAVYMKKIWRVLLKL